MIGSWSTLLPLMQEMHLPLAGLESFCQGSLLYSPFIEDLSQENITPGISQSLQLALFPAVALCDPNLLRGISFQSSEAQKSEWNLDSILNTTGWDVAFLAEENDLQKAVGKNWMLLVISLALALSSLQECQLKTHSPVVCNFWTISIAVGETVHDMMINLCYRNHK